MEHYEAGSLIFSCSSLICMELSWSNGNWKPYGKDLETALQSHEARSCTMLDLDHNLITSLPDSLGLLYLGNGNQLTSLPDSVGSMTNLTVLALDHNKLTSLPDSLGLLTNLTELDLECNQLTSLPDSLGSLTNLIRLNLSQNQLNSLPDSIGSMTNLNELNLESNQLKLLPYTMGNLKQLEFCLYLNDNRTLPQEFQWTRYSQTGFQKLVYNISIYYGHEVMRAAARRAALFIIARFREGDLAVFPPDMIKLIANEVWKTRENPIWLGADSSSPNAPKSRKQK